LSDRNIRFVSLASRLLRAAAARRRTCVAACLVLFVTAGWLLIKAETTASKSLLPSAAAVTQGPDQNYATFKHTSAKHASLGCSDCHKRPGDNSARPVFPYHPACLSCHTTQFTTAGSAMCSICHSDLNGAKPPLKGFPATFKESFNLKFDHSQHMTGSARPKSGCISCHNRPLNRGAALSIPAGPSAHAQCYTCHTPGSKAGSGREIASCGTCHETKKYGRTSTNSRAFRQAFSHAQHSTRQRLDCAACHSVSPGVALGRQVSSTRATEHFSTAGGRSCTSCHDGQRSFGGDLGFKDCRRCHTGTSFRFPT
jgi:c(7)-type cytochrome triheme protein